MIKEVQEEVDLSVRKCTPEEDLEVRQCFQVQDLAVQDFSKGHEAQGNFSVTEAVALLSTGAVVLLFAEVEVQVGKMIGALHLKLVAPGDSTAVKGEK